MRGPWIQHAFNASASGLATGAGAAAWLALVGADWTNVADHPVALLAAALVKYGVETTLVDTAVGLQLRRNILTTWWPVHRRDILPMAALYVLGAVAAASVEGHPWLITVFVVPVVVVLATLRETARMREQTRAAIHQLADLVDLRDPYTHGHSQRVAALAARLATAMNLPGTQVELIREAARVHDIGKIGTDDHVLQKPGPLDAGEEAEMHKHATYGAELLERVPEFWEGASLVLAHHERPDGGGYPRGLRGSEIPMEVSVIAVADAYDAMTTDRPYRAALPWERARSEFLRHAGTQWEPAVVHAFVALIDAEQPRIPDARVSTERVPEPA
jgi:putative nucleotidyltransferase with HDIG domain